MYLDFKTKCGAEIEARAPGSLRQELDLFILLPRFGSFLALMKEIAPGPLSLSAGEHVLILYDPTLVVRVSIVFMAQ